MDSASLSDDIASQLRQASVFIAGLIVCRSQIQFYPDSHPAVKAVLDKVLQQLKPLLAGGQPLTLGITRQGLLLGETLIEPNNVKFRDYSALLGSFGVLALSFTETLQSDDILRFNRIINTPRSEIWDSGGIIHSLEVAGIQGIEVQAIDSSAFRLTDELNQDERGAPLDSWDNFVRKILLGHFSSSPDRLRELSEASATKLGAELAAILDGVPDEARQQTLKALADCYVKQSDRVDTGTINAHSLDKVSDFISSLDPKVCCDFILNIYNSSHTNADFVERLLHKLPEGQLQEVAKGVATQGSQIPDIIQKLLHKLASHSESILDMDAAISKEGVGDKVQVLMRATNLEEYIPEQYLQALTTILATDRLPDDQYHFLEELRATMGVDQLENKLTDIIEEIIVVIPAEELGEGIRDNLLGQIDFYLNQSNYKSLAKVCRILGSGDSDGQPAFITQSFIQQILTGAAMLGRDKYPEIRELVTDIGAPFVEPLIEKLATEDNRSLRRFWFDCLSNLGEAVRNAALARLNDEQWFVVRNLLVMLRNFNDAIVVEAVLRQAEHQHPKVRSEALRNLLHYQDPAADRLILEELQHADPSRKLSAVQVAEASSSKEVLQQLLNILEANEITNYQFELKSAVVQTLANIGSPLALPGFQKIITSNPLLHRNKHAMLKIEVIRALPRFNAEYARGVLQKISRMPGDPLAVHAAEALKALDGAIS